MSLNNSFDPTVDKQIVDKFSVNPFGNKGNNTMRILDGKKFGGVIYAGSKIENVSGTLFFKPDTALMPYSSDIKYFKLQVTDGKGNFDTASISLLDATRYEDGDNFPIGDPMVNAPVLYLTVTAEQANVVSGEGNAKCEYNYEVNTATLLGLADAESIELTPQTLDDLQ